MNMNITPKSLRLQIGIFGRINTGKSTLLNLITGQDVAITSSVAGTTTDVVEKSMELLPLGPVTFLDTAGLDDNSVLGSKRAERTRKALIRADIAILVMESGVWGAFEDNFILELKAAKKPFCIVANKSDLRPADALFKQRFSEASCHGIEVTSIDPLARDVFLQDLKRALLALCPEDLLTPQALLGDLVPSGGIAVLVVPIDLQAPKGRLILPQVQSIRDLLDNDVLTFVVKEREFASAVANLKRLPDLVVCDSQVVMKTMADTPFEVKCTTFSIIFARYKGDLSEFARGAATIDSLRPGDKVLIAESCSHHAAEDDIGKVKIPRWLKQYVGGDLLVDHCAGRDYPVNIKEYRLIIHCGSCMLTRGEMLYRIDQARRAGVPITNYGVAISKVQGVLKRALTPFPAALDAYEKTLHPHFVIEQ